MQMKFHTNLNCNSCVSKVRPFLDAEPSVKKWEVDIKDPRKILSVEGDALNADTIKQAVAKSGFKVLETTPVAAPSTQSFKPLVLIFSFILVATLLQELSGWNTVRAMNNFMGGFFLVFSFFKFLDLRKFADAYATYDVVAKRWQGYGMIYPFLELGLGMAYLSQRAGAEVHGATLILMGISSLGVIQALSQKRTIECACLGTVFNLPMTKVTLFEDLLMVGMALFMLLH